jgi:hypothetical protein
MHCPVIAAFAIFAGAVERIDNPHPAAAEPFAGIEAFLGQHGVIGPCRHQSVEDQPVGALVAQFAERARGQPAAGPQIDQQVARCRRDLR